MEEQGKLEKFISHIKEYAETRLDLMILNTEDKLSDVLSSVASVLVLTLVFLTTILFLSAGAAWWLGETFGSLSLGLFCVAIFYMIVGIVVYCFRDKWIKMPLINFLLKKINLNEED